MRRRSTWLRRAGRPGVIKLSDYGLVVRYEKTPEELAMEREMGESLGDYVLERPDGGLFTPEQSGVISRMADGEGWVA